MKLGFKRGEKGFTLIEIIIVLAVLGVLSAIIVPNVQGFLGQGKERGYSADAKILQAAVDGWRTDVSNRAGNQWPTIGGQDGNIGGTIGTPSDGTTDGDFVDATDNNTFIDVLVLANDGFLKSAKTVKSFMVDVDNVGTTNTNTQSGSYLWFINSSGVVESWLPGSEDSLGTDPVDVDPGELGFQSNVYP